MSTDMTRRERERLGTANKTILATEARQAELDDMSDARYVATQRVKAHNAQADRMAEVEAGVPFVSQDLALQRAMSRRRSQDFKNYTDQYSSLTRDAMGTELQSAIDAYRMDKSQENTVRLQAAIASADERKMNRELLDMLGQSGVNGLHLMGNDNNDQLILSQMAGSNNTVLNQFAKARMKNSGTTMSLNEFMNTIRPGDNLADVLNSKGPAIMNGMDDDTLSYINGNSRGAAIDTGTIFNAAMQTSDAKELAQFNAMLSGRKDYSMKTSDFANIKLDTLRSLDPSIYAAALAELQNGSESSQRIIGKMDQAVRTELRSRGATGGI